jgi:predicted ester cyclase
MQSIIKGFLHEGIIMRLHRAVFALTILFYGLGAASTVSAQDTSTLQYREAIRRLVDEVYNKGQIGVLDEIFAETYTRYPAMTDRDSFKKNVLALRAAFPDLMATPVLLIAQGNTVALHLVIRGTFEGDLVFPDSVPIPATHQPLELIVNSVFVFTEQGKASIEWTAFDNLSFLAAIGIIEPLAFWDAPDWQIAPTPSSVTAAAKDTMSAYYQAMSAGDFDFVRAHLLENFVGYNPFGDFDRDGYIQDWRSLHDALSDFQITIQMTTAEGDWIAVVYTLSGTFNRDFVLADGSTVPPTGGQIKLDIITFHQFTEQLLLQQTREIYDGWSLLSQIKLVPDNPPPSIN